MRHWRLIWRRHTCWRRRMRICKTQVVSRQTCERMAMNARDPIPILRSIVSREQENGCPMADESLIEPALKRWRTYERRNRRNKTKSLEHRTLDLKKGLLALFP